METKIEVKKGLQKSRQVILYMDEKLDDAQKVNECDFEDMMNVTLRLV